MLAVHVGVLDEEIIWNMRYPFFNQCLIELGLKLNYAAVVNYAGNAFAEKSWEMITKANPMKINLDETNRESHGMNALTAFINSVGLKIASPCKGDEDNDKD